MDPSTTIPELFAIIRQWVPQVQHKIDLIGEEVRVSLCVMQTNMTIQMKSKCIQMQVCREMYKQSVMV